MSEDIPEPQINTTIIAPIIQFPVVRPKRTGGPRTVTHKARVIQPPQSESIIETPSQLDTILDPVIETSLQLVTILDPIIATPIIAYAPKPRAKKAPSIKKPNEQKFSELYTKLAGKKVLIIDTESTGFIKEKGKNEDFTNNDLYETCRIVEIGYYYSDNFSVDDQEYILHNHVRKPDDNDTTFKIGEGAEKVHGISMEKVLTDGIPFSDILKKNLYTYLNTADYIIAHNINFDLYLILNELYRIGQNATIKRLLQKKQYYKTYCTCFMTGFTKLTKLYEEKFGSLPETAHRAGDDVKTLLELILGKQIKTTNATT